MARIPNTPDNNDNGSFFEVVHPLNDVPEKKISLDEAGPMRMTRTVKISLIILRVYLFLIILLLIYAVLNSSGAINRVMKFA